MDNVRPLRAKPRSARASRRRRVAGRTILAIVVALVVLALMLGGRVLGLYVDWLWFGEVGFRGVFWTRIWWRVLIGVAAAALFFVIVAGNVELARRLAPSFRVTPAGDLLEPRSDRMRRWVGRGGLAVSLVAAVIAGFAGAGRWETFLLYVKQASFGTADPIFGRDAAFYVFSLPMWQALQGFVFAALVAALAFAAIMHLVMGGIAVLPREPGAGRGPGGRGAGRDTAAGGASTSPFARVQQAGTDLPQVELRLEGRAVAHLSGILAAIFVVVGVGQLFRGWNLLFSTAGAVYGAGYADVHVRLPVTYVMMALAFIIAAALVWNIRRRHQWWPLVVVLWIVAVILLRGIVPAAVQSLVVNPNQLAKERTYLGHNLTATQEAYQLSNVTRTNLSPKTRLTADELDENQPTLRNVRLWDPNTLVTSYRQLQELRPYYSFLDADVDRYTVNGAYRQTMLSPRELNLDGLPEQAQTWVNRHITYTHGFGVAMSAVNQVTADGSPDFLVQDVPPRSVKGLEIEQPRIYYGERGTDYTLVMTKDREFDYPGPDGDVYSRYTGTGGIPISPLLNRLAFAVRFGTIKFFTTSSLTSDSRIIFRNALQPRIKAAAPFLVLDQDPYMVIADGRLWWIQDAYTVTSRYPYSTPQSGVNYLRNSVKVVVDAYNGTMKYYTFDDADPLLKTYAAAYPSLFTPGDQLPASLRDHLRYPEDLFNVQAEVYSTYHVSDADVLYNKGDQWAIPDNVSLTGSGPMDAYYVIMRLPGAPKEEFLLMLPFVPNGRQNMISWLGARSDVPNYGKSLNYIFSKSYTVFGPGQVEATINQDPDISMQRTLWGQQGSQVIMGNLLVVPIGDSLLYVQPLYLQSTQTQLPQLKRVIVFYRAPAFAGGDNDAEQIVVMRPTLAEALQAAFGEPLVSDEEPSSGGAGTEEPGGAATGGAAPLSAEARALIARASDEFDAGQAALRAGDFAEYGRQIEALEKTLRELQRLQGP